MNAALDVMINQFWIDFQKDYFHSLQNRPKWNTLKRNLCVNDMVILMDTSAPQHWQLGRVIETFPGSDGRVRNVKVQTRTGKYERSVRALVLLPIAEKIELEQCASTNPPGASTALNSRELSSTS